MCPLVLISHSRVWAALLLCWVRWIILFLQCVAIHSWCWKCANISMIQRPRQCGTWIKRVSLIVKFRARFIMNGKPTSALEWCLVQSLRHSNRLNNAALNVCPARWGDAVYIRTFQFGCSSLLALYNGRHMPFTLAAQLDCCFSSLPFSKKNSTQNVS